MIDPTRCRKAVEAQRGLLTCQIGFIAQPDYPMSRGSQTRVGPQGAERVTSKILPVPQRSQSMRSLHQMAPWLEWQVTRRQVVNPVQWDHEHVCHFCLILQISESCPQDYCLECHNFVSRHCQASRDSVSSHQEICQHVQSLRRTGDHDY